MGRLEGERERARGRSERWVGKKRGEIARERGRDRQVRRGE